MQTKRTTTGQLLTDAQRQNVSKEALAYYQSWEQEFNAGSKNVIYVCITGSHAYGFATVESDIDLKGIWLAPTTDFFQLSPPTSNSKKASYLRHSDEYDIELYELVKFIHLAVGNNPNILDILCVKESNVIINSEIVQELRDNVSKLLNKKNVYHSYTGYALQQFSRMRNLYTKFKTVKTKVTVFNNEEYSTKLTELREQYDRNDWDKLLQRTIEVETKVPRPEGERMLNVKNAAHLLRLLTVGEHILRTGEVIVEPPNRDLLVRVRSGDIEWEEIVTEKEKLEKKIQKAYENSPLSENNEESQKWANDFLIKVRKNQLSGLKTKTGKD
jgi:hypothetical protein